MKNQGRIEPEMAVQRLADGKDELNLAEFPLCTLAHRSCAGRKTLTFEDRIWDKRASLWIPRVFTITGSDAFGLPTALDDDVLLALIQISKQRSFADRKVPFTRYQVIQILGWRKESKSYERIEQSLNRWTGVTLYYQNAWWNKARKCWVNEKFHVLDNVWLCHHGDAVRSGCDDAGQPLRSAFVWNEVLFRSFQAGNLKSINFEFYKDLQSAIAKRLYRFLDKRFFHKRDWDFDLNELACEHIGLARRYDIASLKRKLRPAIAELEVKGYLKPMPEEMRFRKLCAGEWRVLFTKTAKSASGRPVVGKASEDELLIMELTSRGVTLATAVQIVQTDAHAHVKAQIEVFDWLVKKRDQRVSKNPPGFLVSAIKAHYSEPRDFSTWREQAHIKKERTQKLFHLRARHEARVAKEDAAKTDRDKRLHAYWQSLSEVERRHIEDQVLAEAPAFQRKLIEGGGKCGAAAKSTLLSKFLTKRLEQIE